MAEFTDGTRLWGGGECVGGERSSWRAMVDEEEGALDCAPGGRRGDEGRGARAGDGR